MSNLDASLFIEEGGKKYTFASFPDCKVFKDETSGKWVQHLLFGDYIEIVDLTISNDRVKVKARGETEWVSIKDVQKDRILEVNFIDIGQGDGCHLVTPDDQHYLIDAGKGDNMYRYLYWRFNFDNNPTLPFKFKAVLSHPDNDHYLGFSEIFDSSNVEFDKIYHSGLVQRPKNDAKGWNTTLGTKEKLSNGETYISTLDLSDAEVKGLINDAANRSGTGSQYPSTLFKALDQTAPPVFESLNSESGFLTGQGGEDEFSIKVLAPIQESVDGKQVLRYFGGIDKTKNGHSVLMMVHYKKLRVMLGGDVNEEAGEFINEQYGVNAHATLRADIAKACHHGSHLFNYEFLENINALGTVISSGDDENYSHPRPDTLGALGKTGYSNKPLIFSTELARSNKEFNTSTVPALVEKYQRWEEAEKALQEYLQSMSTSQADQVQKDVLLKAAQKRYKEINSYLTRYGMITLRSDGDKMIMAQKLERDARGGKYDIYKFRYETTRQRFERF